MAAVLQNIPPKSSQTVRKSMKQCSCLTIELKMSGTTMSRFSQEVVSHGSEKVVLFYSENRETLVVQPAGRYHY